MPDGVCQGGIGVGNVGVPLAEVRLVTFRVRLEAAPGPSPAEHDQSDAGESLPQLS
jgi:hypothetical protein